MLFFRWRSTLFHFISSFTAVSFCGLFLYVRYSELFILPKNTSTIVGVILAFLLISLVSAIVGGFYSSLEIKRQLAEIRLGAQNLAYGNLEYRLGFTGNSEFDGIIVAFNEMASRLENQVSALQNLAFENEQLLQEAKVTAISEERQRLARDLHDAVSQQIFAISMLAATAGKIAESKPEKTLQLIKEITLSAQRAQAEMRALLLQLRPLTLQNESLAEALSSLAQELQSRQTIRCNLLLDEVELPKNIENQLFRIAQEALSNVLRHAEASLVTISLKSSSSSRRVLLVIEDNGKGFDPDKIPKSAMGLRSIRERATLLGGTAHWISISGKGTKVEIRIPVSLNPEARSEEDGEN